MPTPSLEKRIIFRRPDGTVLMAYLNPEARLRKNNSAAFLETEDQFVERMVIKLKAENPLWPQEVFVKSKQELNELFSNDPKAHLDRLRITDKGVFYIDDQAKTNEELYQEKRASIRSKLKSGEPLTDDEIDLLIGK